jgi:HKD family nuclease
MSPFLSADAIKNLRDAISDSYNPKRNYTFIVGVDPRYKSTNEKALKELYFLHINSYIFFQEDTLQGNSENIPRFHPKIYLFEGENDIALIVGSSNFTLGGLFNNIESSILLEFKADDEQGMRVVNRLKSYYNSFFNLNNRHLYRINASLIKALVTDGVIQRDQANE